MREFGRRGKMLYMKIGVGGGSYFAELDEEPY